MDKIKIGKLLKEKREEKELSIEVLAEKLGIEEENVIDWENGNSIPDTNLIPKICEIFDIEINDLYSGEIVDEKDYDKKMEENLIKMAKKEETANRRLLTLIYLFTLVTIVTLFVIIVLCKYIFDDILIQVIVCTTATLLFAALIFFSFSLEVDSGYYKCQNCHYKFLPTYKRVLLSMNMKGSKYLKCPKCNKRTWAKKVKKNKVIL